jgi:tripartite-type tricarboxylate transporter receptor subunit TctC
MTPAPAGGGRIEVIRRACGVVLALHAICAGAAEQLYPVRPVRIIVPAPPDGTVDLVARVLGPKLSEQMGQQFIADNRGGAGGVVAAELLASSSPDGYTLGVVDTSFTTNAALRKKASYDPVRDYAPISLVMWTPLVLVANPGAGVESVRDLVALAKLKELNYASAGNGTAGICAVSSSSRCPASARFTCPTRAQLRPSTMLSQDRSRSLSPDRSRCSRS